MAEDSTKNFLSLYFVFKLVESRLNHKPVILEEYPYKVTHTWGTEHHLIHLLTGSDLCV